MGAAVRLLWEGERFGIISTGDVWKGIFEDAVRGDVLGREKSGRVGVGVLGCAGMVGMESWVRDVVGPEVRVVGGVRAGLGVLQGLVRSRF